MADRSLVVKDAPRNMVARGRKQVLEEEEYMGMLEEVIERQYFPHLAKMKKQLEFLQESERFSLHTLRAAYSQLVAREIEEELEESRQNALTVQEFFARYTSEDNESFKEIFAKDMADRRRKLHWLYESLDHLAITDGRQATSSKKAGMLMLYHIGNKVLTSEERARVDAILDGERVVGDDRPSQIDTWAFRVRNQLMFYPDLKDSLQISGVVGSNPGNVAGNPLLLASSAAVSTDSGADVRVRSALPEPVITGRGILSLTHVAHGDEKKDAFAVPSKPTRKSIAGLAASSEAENRQVALVSSNQIQLYSASEQQLEIYRASYASTNTRRADKETVPKNTSIPGSAFADSVDAYLRGHRYQPTPSESTLVDAILPSPNPPLEDMHTPTTYTESPLGRDTVRTKLPAPPPQMPVQPLPPQTSSSSYLPRLGPIPSKSLVANDDWEVASVTGKDSHGRQVQQYSYVEMTPQLSGRSLPFEPIITRGRICGPIIVLEGPLLEELKAEAQRKRHHGSDDDGGSSSGSDSDSQRSNSNASTAEKRRKRKHNKKERHRKESKDSSAQKKRRSNASSLGDTKERRINPAATALGPQSAPSTDDDAISFRFQAPRQRELLAFKLDAAVQAKKRQKTETPLRGGKNDGIFSSATPGGRVGVATTSGAATPAHSHSQLATPRRLSDLTPAAQKLAQQVHNAMQKQGRKSF